MSYVNRKQNEQIAALVAEIEALKARVAELESAVAQLTEPADDAPKYPMEYWG